MNLYLTAVRIRVQNIVRAATPGIPLPVASILDRFLEAFQLRFGAQYGSRNQEPAETIRRTFASSISGKNTGTSGGQSILNKTVASTQRFEVCSEGMKTLSLDLRERILASYDNLEGTRQEIADRYRVYLGMVKKLLQQRRRTGQIASQGLGHWGTALWPLGRWGVLSCLNVLFALRRCIVRQGSTEADGGYDELLHGFWDNQRNRTGIEPNIGFIES
jgi:hypothetical protein